MQAGMRIADTRRGRPAVQKRTAVPENRRGGGITLLRTVSSSFSGDSSLRPSETSFAISVPIFETKWFQRIMDNPGKRSRQSVN